MAGSVAAAIDCRGFVATLTPGSGRALDVTTLEERKHLLPLEICEVYTRNITKVQERGREFVLNQIHGALFQWKIPVLGSEKQRCSVSSRVLS